MAWDSRLIPNGIGVSSLGPSILSSYSRSCYAASMFRRHPLCVHDSAVHAGRDFNPAGVDNQEVTMWPLELSHHFSSWLYLKSWLYLEPAPPREKDILTRPFPRILACSWRRASSSCFFLSVRESAGKKYESMEVCRQEY